MAHQDGFGDACNAQQSHDTLGRRLNGGGRLATTPTVAGQVDGQNIPAMVGKVT